MKSGLISLLAVCAYGQANALLQIRQGRPVIDAHNCYPYIGQWADRIEGQFDSGSFGGGGEPGGSQKR